MSCEWLITEVVRLTELLDCPLSRRLTRLSGNQVGELFTTPNGSDEADRGIRKKEIVDYWKLCNLRWPSSSGINPICSDYSSVSYYLISEYQSYQIFFGLRQINFNCSILILSDFFWSMRLKYQSDWITVRIWDYNVKISRFSWIYHITIEAWINPILPQY